MFIWGSFDKQHKPCLIGWNSLCQPKACRGLGFRNVGDNNEAFFLKLVWTFFPNSSALWVRVLHGNIIKSWPLFLTLSMGRTIQKYGEVLLEFGLNYCMGSLGWLIMLVLFIFTCVLQFQVCFRESTIDSYVTPLGQWWWEDSPLFFLYLFKDS